MGRDWYWAAGRFFKRADGGFSGGGGGRREGADREVSTSSSGCMSVLLNFFDFQQLHFPVQNPKSSFKPSSHAPQDIIIVPEGTEAPRNSLESDDGIATISTTTNEEDNLKLPVGIQIKTNLSTKAKAGILNDETSNSPGTKTPTLVARLMGLDLLPDAQSPSSPSVPSTLNSQVKSHPLRPRQHVLNKPRNSTDSDDITSCRSLPETPRISLARRSDVDHRLSLQINKENSEGLTVEFELSRLSFSRKKVEEQAIRSPSRYARQIAKQVKESVSRKVGLDITNTVKIREHRKDEILLNQLKSKKVSNREMSSLLDNCSPGNHSNSCSPRLKFIETKNKIKPSSSSPATPKDQNYSHTVKPFPPQSIRVMSIPKATVSIEQQKQQEKKKIHKVPKCKKAASEKFSSKLKKPPQTSDVIRNKQEESFVRPLSTNRADIKNKCKKSNPLSSNLVLNLPTPLPVRKNPSPPATKIIQKQSSASLRVSDNEESNQHRSQLSSCSSQANKQEAEQKPLINRERENDDRDRLHGDASITGTHQGTEFQYVCDLLNRTGIQRGTKVSFNNWFSPSHPLDPSIFLYLEECSSFSTTSTDACNNPLDYRCNRKLLFDVVDEVLVEILKPCINMKPWIVHWSTAYPFQMQGSKLMEMLCTKLRSYPMADCQFLEDIDELIEGDLSKLREDVMAFEQEGEGLVEEMEGDILDTLLHETVCGMYNYKYRWCAQ